MTVLVPSQMNMSILCRISPGISCLTPLSCWSPCLGAAVHRMVPHAHTPCLLLVQSWGWLVWSLPFYACLAPSQWQCVVYEPSTSGSGRLSTSCLLMGPMGEENHFQAK